MVRYIAPYSIDEPSTSKTRWLPPVEDYTEAPLRLRRKGGTQLEYHLLFIVVYQFMLFAIGQALKGGD